MEEFGGLRRIGQIALHVGGVDQAVEYYRDTLGMRLLFRVPGPPAMAFFDCAGIRLLLGEAEGDEPTESGTYLYFVVEGIERAHAALVARGVEFIRTPHKVADVGERELWLGFFRDPWKNPLALMEERLPV